MREQAGIKVAPVFAATKGALPASLGYAGNAMDEYLWPARNIAEYAYCPRLFYYMEVEGIHLPSADTEEGNRVHRRADQPSNESVVHAAADPDAPKSVRSLTLARAALNLTATLDLAEIEGDVAVPVEYRKGKPRQLFGDEAECGDAIAPWPTDRVQVGLQCILLEESGYSVPHAILYYASEKRRVVVPFDSALRSEAFATLDAAKACAQGPRPLPLVNDPRCPRCSLQPICLPDELNQHRKQAEGSATPNRRKLWPPRDDGIHIVAQQDGTKVGVRGATMTIANRDGKKLKEVPLVGVESLSLVGSVQVSTQALHTLTDRGIPVAFLTGSGRMVAMVDPLDSASADTRRAQVRGLDQPEHCLELSRALVTAKIANQRTVLMRNYNGTLPRRIAEDLTAQGQQAARGDSIDSVRGHEGQAAAIYFGRFAGIFKSKLAAEFDANGRKRRPPPDPINAALSFAYSMLTHECTAALRTARLEPSIGAFHVSRPGRPALSLDLMEPFRPLIADSVVITAFNRGELKAGHFVRTAAGCMLTDMGRKAFFGVYGRRLADEVTHPVFEYTLSYRRMIVLHARMIAAWLLGEIPSLAFLTTR
ncbi:MAG: CRISPR-associated endonuclease Cas1 [Pirellulaceae bacterium]